MSTAIQKAFLPAKQSVDWADDAITEFKVESDNFFNGDCCTIFEEVDPQTREHISKIKLTKEVPPSLTRKATEALNNTRHGFDQAVFGAMSVLTNSRDKRYFPWAKTPTDLNHLLKSRGIDQRLWDIFIAHEPYRRADSHPGGNDVVRALAEMANRKHSFGLAVTCDISSIGYPDFILKGAHSLIIKSPVWNAEKNEAELSRWIGDVKNEGKYRFSFQVVFQEAGLPHPVNAHQALRAFVKKAKALIEALEVRCVELTK